MYYLYFIFCPAHAREVPRFARSPVKICLKKYRSFSPPNGPKPYNIVSGLERKQRIKVKTDKRTIGVLLRRRTTLSSSRGVPYGVGTGKRRRDGFYGSIVPPGVSALLALFSAFVSTCLHLLLPVPGTSMAARIGLLNQGFHHKTAGEFDLVRSIPSDADNGSHFFP